MRTATKFLAAGAVAAAIGIAATASYFLRKPENFAETRNVTVPEYECTVTKERDSVRVWHLKPWPYGTPTFRVRFREKINGSYAELNGTYHPPRGSLSDYVPVKIETPGSGVRDAAYPVESKVSSDAFNCIHKVGSEHPDFFRMR